MGGSKRKVCFLFRIAQLRCEECYMNIAQEVNIAQLKEVTQLTVTRILESALAMPTTMTCCSARRMNQPQEERGRSDFVAAKCQRLGLKLPKKKAPLAESSNRFAVPVDKQSREKASESYHCRHC